MCARTRSPCTFCTLIWPLRVSRSTEDRAGNWILKFISPMSPRPRLSPTMSITRPDSVWRGLKVALRLSISAVTWISSRSQVSTVIVPVTFFSSKRTFLPAGKRRDTFCWARAKPDAVRTIRIEKTAERLFTGLRLSEANNFIGAQSGDLPAPFTLVIGKFFQQCHLVVQGIVQDVLGNGVMRVYRELFHRVIYGRIDDSNITIESITHLLAPARLVQIHALVPIGDHLLLLPVAFGNRVLGWGLHYWQRTC